MSLQLNSLLSAGLTLKHWVPSIFDENKVTIAMHVMTAKSHISISLDEWISSNNISVLGIVAHWSDEEYNLRSALICLKEVQFNHVESHLAKIVIIMLERYDNLDKISYFMFDNAPNMTTTIEEISRQLFVLNNTILTPEERQLRCYKHIINLVVNVILRKTNHFHQLIVFMIKLANAICWNSFYILELYGEAIVCREDVDEKLYWYLGTKIPLYT